MKNPTCRCGARPRHPALLTIALLALLLGPAPAFAYIGPGLAFGTLMLATGFIGSGLLALLALIWYPLKRLLRRGRRTDEAASESSQKPPR